MCVEDDEGILGRRCSGNGDRGGVKWFMGGVKCVGGVFNNYGGVIYGRGIYIYIYICVCVCVCLKYVCVTPMRVRVSVSII